MSGFDARWLALREAADHRSRSEALTAALEAWFATRGTDTRRLADLGCGTGSNVRYLVPRLEGRQHWTCVDDDAALLRDVARIRFAGVTIGTRRLDLSVDLAALDGAGDAGGAPPHALVGSALLDLVSRAWLETLVTFARRHGAATLFALSYDGRIEAEPAHQFDAVVLAAFNTHQQRDKGFGPALGPGSCETFAALLGAAGYAVKRDATDWRLDARAAADAALLEPLVDGIAVAALEQAPQSAAAIGEWRDARLAQCADGTLRMMVGHEDILGLPPAQDPPQ